MKLVHSTPDRLFVHVLRTLLEGQAIACEVRREGLSLLAGDVPVTETWAQVWVEDSDAERAASIVTAALAAAPHPSAESAAAWTCACGESLDATFDACWSCGASRGDVDPPPSAPA